MKKKKLFALLLALSMILVLLAGCGSGKSDASDSEDQSSQTGQTEGAETDAAEDTTEDSTEAEISQNDTGDLSIKYAQGFDIQYMDNSVKLVTDYIGQQLLLVPDGVEVPDGYEDVKVISTPIQSAMYTSTTYVGYLDELDNESVYDSIVALTTVEEDWTTQEIIDRFDNGQITYIAMDEYTVGDIEDVVTVGPQIVFNEGESTTGSEQRDMLDEVGIDYAAVTTGNETDNYAMLEWIKFFAAFYNLDEEANEIFEQQTSRLDDLYAQMVAIPGEDRPVVAFGSVWEGTVYTVGEGSRYANDIEAAGAIYALADEEGYSLTLTMEEFVDKCKDADILIYNSLPQYMMGTSMEDEDELFAEFKAVQNNQVYILDKGYYMNAAKLVEKVEDLVAICHPDLMTDHTFVMFQPFDTGY